jgi:hypothetical protein
MRLYVAAPLFTEAERGFNVVLARALEAEGHQVYLPQRDTPPSEGGGRTTAIFWANLAALRAVEAVVGSRARPDPSPAWVVSDAAVLRYPRRRGPASRELGAFYANHYLCGAVEPPGPRPG